jgi:hypothetical protein
MSRTCASTRDTDGREAESHREQGGSEDARSGLFDSPAGCSDDVRVRPRLSGHETKTQAVAYNYPAR